MRRVDAEGDSRGVQVQKQGGSRRKARLRRAAIESLERRELLSTSTSTLPSPTVLSAPNVTPNQQVQDVSLATSAPNLTATPNASTPSVSVDPINPLKMVATWVDQDTPGYPGGNFTAPVTSYIEGAFSIDGGRTWSALPAAAFGGVNFFGETVNVQQDFSVKPSGSFPVFTLVTDASIAFDRNENFYILSSSHNAANTVGQINFQRFSFVGTHSPTYSGMSQIYTWDQVDSAANGGTVDQALTPTLAVDTNPATITDPTTNVTQTDPFSGNIYVAWAEIDSAVYNNAIPNFNPDTIKLTASSDQGLQFTHAAYVDNSSNANNHNIGVTTNPPMPEPLHDAAARYTAPQIAISAGNVSGTVPAGQVTIVYDDYGTVAPLDQILSQTNTLGGTSEQFGYSNALQIPNIGASIPITVNITDPKFTSLQDLDVTTTIAWPNISEIGAVLVPPAPVLAYLQSKLGPNYNFINLFGIFNPFNPTGDVGINNSSGTPSSAANLGATTGSGFGAGSGTVFDPEAVRDIENGNVGQTAAGHFQPNDERAFLLLKGLSANPKVVNGVTLPGLNGTWNFEAVQLKTDTSTSPKFVNGVTLNFTSGDNPGSVPGPNVGGEVTIAGKNSLFLTTVPDINPTNPTAATAYGTVIHTDNPASQFFDGKGGTNVSGNPATPTVAPAQGALPILPAPTIASDNTLGSFSPHQGRLYVTFTGMITGAQAGNTDIFLSFSDDGGQTWSSPQQVNDDNAATDGYSAAVAGGPLGRTQYQPQVAVDQSTGEVVLSWLDARNDPSDARVATYIAASNDGGSTFAADVYANPTQVATDAATGNAVNLGPIPDNQSTAGGVQGLYGYGTHQALIVVNGRIVPFWTSNQNKNVKSAIVDSILSLTAGPRVIASTQGPVGTTGDVTNQARAADGTTLANTILLTFDRAVDPGSFKTTNVAVFYESPSGGAQVSLPIVSVAAVTGTATANTQFRVTFNPSALPSFVGTYSYVIIPTGITSRIRAANAVVDTPGAFAFAAPAGSGTGPVQSYAQSAVSVSGHAGQFLIGNPTGTNNLVNAAYPTGNVAGTITATITAGMLSVPNPPNPMAANFEVYLVTPDGQRVALNGVVSQNGNGPLYTLSATNFTVPWVNTVPLDGTYTLEVVDDANLETITIGNWTLTLNGVLATASTSAGVVMDQNANGRQGQVPGDDYVVGQPTGFATYAAGTLPLIVPGVHVSSTVAVDPTGAVVGSGGNDLVLNNSVGGLRVTFDRNIKVNSFDVAQVLSLFGPAGPVSLAGLTITPLTVFTTSGQATYAGGATADVFRITFATQQISGTYTLTLGTGIVAADGTGVDASLNAGLDVLRGTATNGVTAPVTYAATSAAVPATIAPATVNTDGTTSPGVLMSPIVVPDNFPIQGDNTATGVSGITLTLNITYPHDPDLVAYLLAPDGVTKVNLFTGVGAGTNNANFTSTTLSDTASTSIDKAGAPFFGTFLPEGPFANLAGVGLTSLGTWTLVIQNSGFSTGTLSGWSLTFQKPVSATGLAEFPVDQSNASFQIFNLAANNQLANSTWTAVGPTGVTTGANGQGTLAGTVSTIAVDPSDTTGNTVYVGTASGGIWKTMNFNTTNPGGPTYVPLTDFGPSFTLNIGGLAVFGRNNDPGQSIIFAGTGFAQERTNATNGNPNIELNTGLGGGMLRSMDGGKTWQVVGPFAGASTYKVVVDPTPNLNGQAIVYAATSRGLYQSLDSGNTWTSLGSGNATDVILDPVSKSPTTGNLDRLYVAFSNPTAYSNAAFAYSGPVGIYVSTNQGQTLQPVNGQLGKDPLLVTPGFPAQPIPVQNAAVTPNNPNSAYIVLAKPALTGNVAVNLNYQGWLYAAVENYNGTFQGLYVTKDAGDNWTLVQLPNIPGTGSVKAAVPTNDTTGANSYDPTSSNFTHQGAYDLTLTIDPTNPNIVYIGGSHDFQGSGLIRVNLTDLRDAHNFTSFSNNSTDGGLLTTAAQGGVVVTNPANGPATYDPIAANPESQILNLRYAPNNGTPGTSPFNINATLVLANTTSFVNNGTGVTWSLFDEPLKANAGDPTGSTNLHAAIDYVDPITGDVRILFADDEGVFTALVNPDGTINNGIGSDVAANYSRNGNLQDEQFFTSAAEPSLQASTQAGAEFFASGQTTIAAQSDPNVLTDGNLTWDNSAVLSPGSSSPRNTTANASINSSDRSGVGIATDQTGGKSASNPNGSPSLYEFDVPILGGNLTDFFRVNQFGQTTGLASDVNQEFPADGYRGDAHQAGVAVNPVTTVAPGINGAIVDGQIPEGDFVVNPLNGQQILIASATGTLYETTNQGILWTPIGSAADFGAIADLNNSGPQNQIIPIQVSAIAYGAPDPNATGGVGNLNNFIYVGTSGVNYTPNDPTKPNPIDADGLLYNDGHIYVTRAGGQGWTDISKGLDGSSVVGIYPDPDRGSHAAHAVTLTGVFYSPDTLTTPWVNITSNLTALVRNPFGNAAYQQSVLAGFSYTPINPIVNNAYTNLTPAPVYNTVYNSQYGGFTGIVADYRYEIPAATNATEGTNIFFPVLYASGYGGVFRSIDNGSTWTVFPNTSFDAAPVDGGYLPNVDVTNLQLVLGDINPDTGHAVQAPGDPEVLLATTYGRGDFAIRLAPDVVPTSIHFDATLPAPDGSDSSDGSDITNVLEPYIDGISEISNFGNTVTINLFDESPGPGFGKLLGTGTTNQLGQFVVQIVDSGQDPSFFTSSTAYNDKIVGIQAKDSSGASGNLTLFQYTLDLITPNTPNTPLLEATYDTGRFNNDDLTNLSVPAQAGPGAPLTVATPIFDVTTKLPQANPLTPNPISLTVELLRATSPGGPFFEIDSTQTGIINQGGTAETYMLMDTDAAAQAAAGVNLTFYYEALQVDLAGNVSTPASNVLTVNINTIAPAAPTAIALVTTSTTNPPMPVFSVTGVLPNDQVLLYRSINGGAPILVGSGAVNTGTSAATLQVTDTAGATPDGVYTYYAAQLDVYGNFSPLSPAIVVTINTQTPPMTPILVTDTGRSTIDDVTNIAVPAPTPGSPPNFVPPVFDVNTVAPTGGQPPIATVQLFRSASPTGPFAMVGTTVFNGNPAMVTDPSLPALAAQQKAPAFYYYEADQINAAGIESAPSGILKILLDAITPATLPTPTLDPSSSTGLIANITNKTKPTFDVGTPTAPALLSGNQLFLYRSFAGAPPILVGTGPINTTASPIFATVTDTTGATPDGVYQYFVVQQDIAGNISNYSQALPVTINTTVPPIPTINLLASDDTGLPLHPNVTNVNTPHFNGTSQYNAGTNFPVDIVNTANGQVLTSIHYYPAANGTYLAQITNPLPDGIYTLEARTENLAGTFSFSKPLTITIKHIGPLIPPSLRILPADDTGIAGDGVTANHNPRLVGTTDKGDTVSIYVLSNGQLLGPEATTTSSTVDGSFTLRLPFNLTDGATQLVAQTSDIAGNKGVISTPLSIRIVTTAGDYLGGGSAQLVVFNPYTETYSVRNAGTLQVDSTPGRDVPIQYDINGDGITDLNAYRYNTAEYYGTVSNGTQLDQGFGPGGFSLPVSGYFGTSGTYIYGSYQPSTAYWEIALPIPGGLVVQFGVPKVDVPVPAAYNGNYSTELALFRPSTVFGNDADSFTVLGPQGGYYVSFTSPAVLAKGFVYKAGDIAAPADYDGVGHDEFAVYRPSTGQFFILNTPLIGGLVDVNPADWTLRTVTMNLPGGPNAADVPVSEDYDGTGKVDPAVYRPSNSTFYILHATTGIQSNIPFGTGNLSIAAAGPILYRLTALKGTYATTGGYAGSSGGGATPHALSIGGGGGQLHALSIASAGTSTSAATASAGSPLATMIAVSAPMAITTSPAPAPTAVAPKAAVTIGATTPVAQVSSVHESKATPAAKAHLAKAKKATKPLAVDSKSHQAEAKAQAAALAKAQAAALAKAQAAAVAKPHAATATKSHAAAGAMAVASLQHLVMAKKGQKKG